MKKEKGIALLNIQIDKINNKHISREEWIISTSSVLLRVFPISSAYKIAQIEKIETTPEYYQDISVENQIQKRKLKAKNYLENYKEEIELLGIESQSNTLEIIFRSFRFWCIIVAIAYIGYYGGENQAVKTFTTLEGLKTQQFTELQQQFSELKKENMKLKKENEELGFFKIISNFNP